MSRNDIKSTAMKNRLNPLTAVLFGICLVFSSFSTLPALAQSADEAVLIAKRSTRGGDVFLLRGFANVFSRGLDQMGAKLEKRGVDVTVISHQQWRSVVEKIVKNRRKFGRRPVILIGHSLGANAIIRIAKKLREKRIRVDYMATFAATKPDPVPANVRKATNYFFKTDGWGKPLKRGKGFRGTLKNIDFSSDKKIGHFNIDKQPRLQRQVINNVLRYIRPKRRTAKKVSKKT